LSFLASSDGNSTEEKELRNVVISSEGLCTPHYARLLFNSKGRQRAVPDWIKEFHETKFRNLLHRIDKFIELSAYGKQKEFAALSEEDQLVWKEAAVVLRGTS
jgi:hypothetical protein